MPLKVVDDDDDGSQLTLRTVDCESDTVIGSKNSRVNGKCLFFNTEVRHMA